MENYIKLDNGIIKQSVINKIEYNYEYSNKYNNYGEKCNYLSFMRLGVLIGALNKTPTTILDVGFGNGSFLKAANTIIEKCYGYDISDYPAPENIVRVTSLYDKHYDVICFFDSLEHFDDIYIINKLNCDYIYIYIITMVPFFFRRMVFKLAS